MIYDASDTAFCIQSTSHRIIHVQCCLCLWLPSSSITKILICALNHVKWHTTLQTCSLTRDNLIRDNHSMKKNCKLWSPLGSDSQPARPLGQALTLNGPLATYSSSWSSLKRFRRNSDLETAAPISWDSRSRWALARGSGWAESWKKHDAHLFTFPPPHSPVSVSEAKNNWSKLILSLSMYWLSMKMHLDWPVLGVTLQEDSCSAAASF